MSAGDVGRTIRLIVADVAGRDAEFADELTDDTELFGSGVGLGSVSGARLLEAVEERLGVDVAGEDLNLDSLRTIGTLTEFVAARVR